MQGKGFSLRLSILALVVVLIFGSLGGLTLARDAFDAKYDDCPAATRLDAVDGLTIDRTDEDDEIRIAWDELDSATLSSLGPNGYRARLTVIVDGEDARNVALGDTWLVVDDIDFAEDLTVSVAITLGDYVISDIAEADFTSGLPAPRFSSDIRVSANKITTTGNAVTNTLDANDLGTNIVGDPDGNIEKAADEAEFELLLKTTILTGSAKSNQVTVFNGADDQGQPNNVRNGAIAALTQPDSGGPSDATLAAVRIAVAEKIVDADDKAENVDKKDALKDLGTFYYLGFNDLFDNWYVAAGGADQRPKKAKFRVGLRHGNDKLVAGDADFENYRIVIEDSNGDLLGYQAETVVAGRTYDGNKIVFSSDTTDDNAVVTYLNETDVGATTKNFSNIRLSNRVTGSAAVSPYFGRALDGSDPDFARPTTLRKDLTYGNVGLVDPKKNQFPAAGVVYADAPLEYFDFPSDVFEADGSYTIKAWAEDDDGTRISPQASIVLGAQERESATGNVVAGYTGYASGIRVFAAKAADEAVNTFTVYGFSIQDE